MTKKWVLAVALLSLAISMGCRNVTGVSKVRVVVSNPGNLSVLYVTQVVQFTATVTGTSNTAVTWSLSSTGCTGSACGTLTSGGLYTAPATSPGSNVNITITATSQADSTASDSMSVKVHQITVQITPNPANVGVNLTQQFTAVVIPDDAPQTVTWSIPPASCTGGPCGSIDAGTGIYSAVGASAGATLSVQAAVPPSLDPSGFNTASVAVVNSRLAGNSTYAFRFSGFDIAGATARVGNFVVAADGKTISSGVEDELTTAGPAHRTLTGSYAPASNNQGTITLNPSGGVSPNTYTVVLDANGDIQMIESDGNGSGSGVIEQVAKPSNFNTSALNGNFVFGFTGADVNVNRVGYAGFLPMDGAGNIAGGLLDTNDNGGGTNGTPLNIVGGSSYSMSNGIGTMTLITNGPTFTFHLYAVSGATPPKAKDPLTVYAISTDAIAANPAVSGTVVFQDPGPTYNNAAFKSTSVVSLTGVDSTGANTNVSLTVATTDGSGNLSGSFDQNNGGIIVDVGGPLSNPAVPFSTGYTYSATGSGGRYTFKLLGNPNANPAVPPLTFVLYASAANQGFLLDQSSTSVMTGTMYLQSAPKAQQGIFSASNIPGTYAAATTSSGTSGVDPIAANLLLTWANPAQGVSGFQYDAAHAPPGEAVTGAYTLQASGFGTVTLTAPSAESYVIYAIDITHILVMDVDKTNADASIIYAQQ